MRFFNIEGYDNKITKKQEINKEEKEPSERLGKEEALLYQSYATEKEGVDFSEQADEQSYAEADLLIKELQSRGFDFDGMDYNALNLRDAYKLDKLNDRLEKSIAKLVNPKTDSKGILEKINGVLGVSGIGKTLVLISICSSLFATSKDALAFDSTKNSERKSQQPHESTYKKDGLKIIFEYNKDGMPVKHNIVFDKAMNFDQLKNEDTMIKNILVKDYRKMIRLADRVLFDSMQETSLKMGCRNIIMYMDLYKDFAGKNMNDEAVMMLDSITNEILMVQSDVGANVFNREFIMNQLKAQ